MLVSGLSVLAAAVGALPAAESKENWVAMILKELGRSQASGFVVDLVKWTLLGALLGVLVAILACVLFSRLGWYEVNMRFARGLRWTVFILVTILSAIFFGVAGFWDGAIRGSERVLSGSQLATAVFPRIADAIADAMAWVQVQAAAAGNTNRVETTVNLEEFRAGKHFKQSYRLCLGCRWRGLQLFH